MLHGMTLDIVWKLLLAALLGGLIGLERELKHKPAGIRTSMFICLGSAMFTILSYEMARRFNDASATRIVSNLIPGIGFLGAGSIIRERGSVMGLTTAATIFVMASIGLAVGVGFASLAIFATAFILVCLVILGWVEDRLGLKTRLMTFRLTTHEAEKVMTTAHEVFSSLKIAMQHFQIFRVGSQFVIEFDADVSHPLERRAMERLSKLDARCEVVPNEATRE
jgi:putative Mg2+ transporter-C (MgtC) family protein